MITQNMINRIKDYYDPKFENEHLVFTKPIHKILPTPIYDEKIFLGFGEIVKCKEEANEKGIFSTTIKDLIKSLFPEEWENVKHRYEDEKTQKYLSATKENIGLIDIRHGWDEEKFNVIEKYNVWFNAEDVKIGQLDNSKWIAQYSVRTDIDDYDITRMYFFRKPNENDILTARLLESIEFYFNVNGYDKSVYTCWECGCKQHWVDIEEKDINEKWEYFKEKYCGC